MAIPNFNEILNEARAYQKGKAEQVASERTSGLMASGLSGFASSLINAPVGPRKTYTGELTGEGFQPYERPRETGGTAGEMGMRKLFDRGAEPEAMGGVPLTQPQAADYTMRKMLQKPTTPDKPIMFMTPEQERAQAAKGEPLSTKYEYQTTQEKKAPKTTGFDEWLTPNEALKLRVPYGTTRGEAIGIHPMSESDKKGLSNFKSATAVIEDIKKYSELVNTFEAGYAGAGRVVKGTKRWIGGVLQTDPNVTMLGSKKAHLAKLLRSMGEVGVLTDRDIKRGEKAVPSAFDTKTVAETKLSDLDELFIEIEEQFAKFLTTPLRSKMSFKKYREEQQGLDGEETVGDGMTDEQRQAIDAATSAGQL